MTQPAVELRDVFCVHRSSRGDAAALQGMNLTLGFGEFLCVLGPSGAGKSTLLRVIAGLQLPQAGVVSVLGRDIGRLPSRRRARLRHERLGFLAQHSDAALPPDLSAGSAVAMPLALRGMPSRARRARVAELLDAAGIRELAEARPDELSGGERQRVALCVALAHRPSLLLADEPTGELDEAAAAAVRGLIAELVRRGHASAIVVSHDAAMEAVADRTVQIRDGRVVEEGNGDERAVVVDERGWLRLPDEALGAAGIRRLARVSVGAGGLVLAPAGRPPDGRAVGRGVDGRAVGDRPAPRSGSVRGASLELRSVTRGFVQARVARRVIDGLTREFGAGRVTVVAGPSGAGKSTLLRLLAGLDRPDAGEITVDGEALGGDPERLAELRRARIGYLPQEPSPVGFLSALENVILALRLRGWEPGEASAYAEAVLAQVGLAHRAPQRVSRLSAGEGQRVALARALAGARGLLVVDEPTSRLDEANARIVAQLLAAAAEAGNTVVCATHDPLLIRQADELLELRAARGRTHSPQHIPGQAGRKLRIRPSG
jgi:ABC-type lipoprotein export system ATPase subunit